MIIQGEILLTVLLLAIAQNISEAQLAIHTLHESLSYFFSDLMEESITAPSAFWLTVLTILLAVLMGTAFLAAKRRKEVKRLRNEIRKRTVLLSPEGGKDIVKMTEGELKNKEHELNKRLKELKEKEEVLMKDREKIESDIYYFSEKVKQLTDEVATLKKKLNKKEVENSEIKEELIKQRNLAKYQLERNIKEAEDRFKVKLATVQDELKAEMVNTAIKVKEAEDKVKVQLANVQNELKIEKANTAAKVAEAENKIKVQLANVQNELKIEKSNTATKVKEAEDKVKVQLTKVQTDLAIEKENTKKQVEKARAEERELKKSAVADRQKEVDQKTVELRFFTNNFKRVEFAQKYAQGIQKLIGAANKVEKKAIELMKEDKMEDAYYLYRAFARYNLNLSNLNMSSMMAEVEMIAHGQIVASTNMISAFDPTKPDVQKYVKLYFFNKYLSKYINAIVVFTETLSKLNLFDKKITYNDLKSFDAMRDVIIEVAGELGVVVETVQLGEISNSSNVQAIDKVDLGLNSGTIVSLDNCIVYLKGEGKPIDKIKLIVQA